MGPRPLKDDHVTKLVTRDHAAPSRVMRCDLSRREITLTRSHPITGGV